MAKKSLIEAEKRKKRLSERYFNDRKELKDEILKGRKGGVQDFAKIAKLREKIPRNAYPTRQRNRCSLTGRPRAYIRFVGLCRNEFRRLALEGMLAGVKKESP